MWPTLHAQVCDNSNPDGFVFSYNGPDTLFVDGTSCTGVLDWCAPNPYPCGTPTVTNPDPSTYAIIIFDFNAPLTGYDIGDPVPLGTLQVYYTITYADTTTTPNVTSNDTFCFLLTYIDTVPPVFTDPVPADVTVPCPSSIPAPVDLSADDNCDPTFPKFISPVDDPVLPPDSCLSAPVVVTRTWTATDQWGNSTSVSQLITVEVDNSPPIFPSDYPQSVAQACDTADYDAWLTEQVNVIEALAGDNCHSFMAYHDNTPAPATPCEAVEVTFFLEDICGNISSKTATFQVFDVEPPVFVGVPADVTISCADPVPPVPAVTTTDNCSAAPAPSFSEFSTRGADSTACDYYTYTITRIWTATDECGNTGRDTAYVFVEDTEAPDFVVPADITIDCADSDHPDNTGWPANVTDNCASVLDTTWNDTVIPGSCAYEYTIERRWLVSDPCGNTAFKLQLITVQDVTTPVFTEPADITVSCEQGTDPAVTGQPTNVTDNCDPAPTVTYFDNLTPGACPNEYVVERNWMVEDSCGNGTIKKQIITVVDDTPPAFTNTAQDLTITCTSNAAADSIFADWVAALAQAAAADNCPGTLTWMAFNSGTTQPASLPPAICPSPVPGVYRQQTVDFVVVDECGNANTTTATFTVEDVDAPLIQNCPADTVLPTEPGLCEASFTLELPLITEGCNNDTFPVSGTASVPFTVPAGVDTLETPVDSVVLQIPVPGPPLAPDGAVTLTINLVNADAEQATEFFYVVGEDGTILGLTNNTPVQCGNSSTLFSIPAATVLPWTQDGLITITLVPNVPANLPGRYAVNHLCPGGYAEATLSYNALSPAEVRFSYSIDGGAPVAAPLAPVALSLPQGIHTITYYFADCAGNESTCTYTVTVEDAEPPVVLCPPDTTLALPADACTLEVDVPLFMDVSDNCAVTTPVVAVQPADSAAALLTFSWNPDLNDYVADDKTFVFNGLSANATAQVTLTITLQGDVDEPNEYFNIYDPDGNLLGSTPVGAGNCGAPATVSFAIAAEQFNLWAAAGTVSFFAESFQNMPPGSPGNGINPCDPAVVTADGQPDSTSFIYATLSYETVQPILSATGATTFAPEPVGPPLVSPTKTLGRGTTTFTYEVTDINGNSGSCSFDITVEDQTPPELSCGPSFVEINPSGFVTDTIEPADVLLSASDNCGIAAMSVAPNLVDCSLIGDTLHVTLTATDSSGNATQCQTFISVEAVPPMPSAVTNCGSDSLMLFANPPSAPGNDVYQYTWSGPNGFVSFEQNPVILDANEQYAGFYTVTITGITGCSASGTLQVTPSQLPVSAPQLQISADTICDSEDFTLSVNATPSSSITYHWYSGTPPAGTLLASTQEPQLVLEGPHPGGEMSFYVVKERSDGCVSDPSNTATIYIVSQPVAVTTPSSITVCEEEPIALGTSVSGVGITYQWSGPNGFSSTQQYPPVIQSATLADAGVYQLIVYRFGCASEPAFATVNVLDKPDTPVPSNPTSAAAPACVGDTILLTATPVAGAVSYRWTSPLQLTFVTTDPVLPLNGLSTAQAGEWTVVAVGASCESNVSQPTTVYVSPLPILDAVTASPEPICEGQTLTLAASSPSQNVSFKWTFPSGAMASGATVAVPNVQLAHQGTYTVQVSNSFGCSVTDSVGVTVNPRVTVDTIVDDAPACTDGPLTIHLTPTVTPPDDGSYTYAWTGPGGYTSTAAVATIANATSAKSGIYTLVVTTGDGCSSLPAEHVLDVPDAIPAPAAPAAATGNTLCEGDMLVLSTTSYGGSVQYVWYTPLGTDTTTAASLSIASATPAHSGSYTVQVWVDGCPSPLSGETFITVYARPVAVPANNGPVCEGAALQLNANCMAGAVYEWTGPNGFTSDVCNPAISAADPDMHAGTYSLRIQLNGCWSDVATTEVVIKPKPATPVLKSAGPFCYPEDEVTLTLAPSSATPNAIYSWFDEAGEPLGPPTAEPSFTLPDPGAYLGTFGFFVVAQLDGCLSDVSNVLQVTINEVPTNQANAGPDLAGCDGGTLDLAAAPPTTGSGRWSVVSGSGLTIVNPDDPNSLVTGLQAGQTYTLQWCLSFGGCTDYSCDEMTIRVDTPEMADAGNTIEACDVSEVSLSAKAPLAGSGQWSQPQAQANLGVTIVEPDNPASPVTGLQPGNSYVFTWTITNGCGSSSDIVLVQVLEGEVFAGNDFIDCGDGTITLSAQPPSVGTGMWTALTPGVEVLQPTNPASVAAGLQSGDNVFVWTVNEGVCGYDTVVVSYKYAPQAVNDTLDVSFAGQVTVDVAFNDSKPADYYVNLLSEPQFGRIETLQNGVFEYLANLGYIGEDFFLYEICSEYCECSTGRVVLNVGATGVDCDIPSVITPNGDGINDIFVVPCLEDNTAFPNNEVSIFNQWGDEVFRARPYNNDWGGTYDGQDLPAGTYFYVVNLRNGDTPLTGFLIIIR